ncbi:maltose ABC transporter substrate-binding protein [Microbacterium sp. 1.5R]|uniref:sugar ABC transporter substrate-binding protein n=1 Tax=Microbacterium TaxID=33882 RepID=UPI0006FDCFD1|nr:MULTISPECIES: extracellular solute-binding protein [unclassified Microbacterium]APH43797.1 maltose ABC transporter substrate-binding protein [Microbacterium sp. 1.5R]KRD54047.1 ABC transporter substrate-binding protein [Microbacterium sp. Root280D1]MBC6493402.1 ABC transporter substrate-binding protein [Microbacterium sp. 4-7]MDY0984143.1 extracellular solute-binding protein [Microbacterium sp. CFBP9023]CAH0200066.1 Maltose-binding periplasmic protein [Microbacterium sp. Bi98]
MRKHIGVGALALAAAVVLAGCSAGAPEGGDDAASGDGAELVIWTDAEREAAITAAAEAFEEETGAKVTLVQKNFEDLRNDFIAQVPTGEGPDITVGAHDWLGALVAAGVVDTIDLGDKASEFEQVALDAMTYDGQLYAMPYSLETIALVQNVDLVGAEAPASWDDMIAKGVAAGTERPFVINTGGETGDGYTMYGLQTSFGAPVFVQDDTGSYTSEVGMGGAPGEAFATWLGANGSNGTGYISTTVDYDINNELFASGKAPYTIQGPWAISAFEGVNVAVNPIPSAGGETAAPFVGVQGFYLSSKSKNALLAQEFLVNYLGTEDAQRALYEADPRIPAWTTLAEEVSSDPITAGFVASAQTGVPMPSIPEMGSVWDLWNAAQAQIINGADPVSTWNTMVADLETTLAG